MLLAVRFSSAARQRDLFNSTATTLFANAIINRGKSREINKLWMHSGYRTRYSSKQTVLYGTVQYSTAQWRRVPYITVQYSAVLYYTIQYCNV